MSINKVMLIGRLGQDPELKYTPAGAAVCNFSMATSESWTDKQGQKQERTEWHRIVVWGKLAELCNQYLAKGRQAFVEGSLTTRQWEDNEGQKRYTTEINARNVQFLGGASAGQGQSQGQGQGQSQGQAQGQNNQAQDYPQNHGGVTQGEDYNSFTADDIPF